MAAALANDADSKPSSLCTHETETHPNSSCTKENMLSAELMNFYKNAPIAMQWLSAEGIITWANQCVLNLLKYSEDEYVGQHITQFCSENVFLSVFTSAQSCGINPVRDLSAQFRTKDGSLAAMLIDCDVKYNVKDAGSKHFSHVHCIIREDTARRVSDARAQLLLNETRHSLELLDNFMARVVHHLKEPLHVLLMGSGVVAENLREAQALNCKLQAKFMDQQNDSNTEFTNFSSTIDSCSTVATAAVNAVFAEQASTLAESAEVVSQAEKSVTQTLLLLDDVSDLMRTDAYGAEAALPLRLADEVDLIAVSREALDAMEPCHPGVTCELTVDESGISRYMDRMNTAGLSDNYHGFVSCNEKATRQIEDKAFLIKTDPSLLKRSLVHLLNNAAAATTCGSVALKLSVDDINGQPVLSVEDTGPGFSSAAFDAAPIGSDNSNNCSCTGSAHHRNNRFASSSRRSSASGPVFERYHHEFVPETGSTDVDEVSLQALRDRLLVGLRCRTSERLGLGLSLSYQLVQALGGELTYTTTFTSRSFDDSRVDNGCASGLNRSGTRFWFSLPATSLFQPRNASEPEASTKDTEADMNMKTITTSLTPPTPDSTFVQTLISKLEDRPPASDVNHQKSCHGDLLSADSYCVGSEPPLKRLKFTTTPSEMAPPTNGQIIPRADISTFIPHILIIEDSSVCAKLICMQLHKLKCAYTRAENGRVALDLLHSAYPGFFDLVLCDLRMPIMDGFDTCKCIKATYQDLPVVALSGESGVDINALVRVTGFDDFVPKPARREQIEFIVKKYMYAGSKG